ncbi:MAG: NAD(P)/FAD-dependent oxidoreductase [Candidatus Rokuibacteriota bacterium]
MTPDADVIVVGAGPAGAATSILLAEHGLAVITLDRARFPRDKICGEYLSPEAGRVLDRLGVLKTLDGAGAVPLAGMRITAPDGTRLEGVYAPTGTFRPYRGHALGVSRAVLDAVLADRLRALGVDFREHVRVTDVVRADGAVAGVCAAGEDGSPSILRAPLVIAADGRASVVAQRLGCRHPHRLRRMAVTTYVSGIDGCRDFGEIFVDPPDYAILNPLAAGRINLSVVVPLEHAAPWSARLGQFLEARVKHMPHLARRLAGARVVAPVQAMGPLAYRVSPPREGGVLLVGDAAGFYDPFTGEGIYSALRSAELAAEVAVHAIRTADVSARALAPYQRRRADVFDDKAKVTRALQVLIRHRGPANLAAHLLARRPALLHTILGVIGDYVPARALLTSVLRRA